MSAGGNLTFPRHQCAAEFMATAGLLISVVGSGIAADRLSGGSVGLALLANAFATGCALFVLILTFGPVSGAHMNPAVTLTAAITKKLHWRSVPAYVFAQISGAIVGTLIAHAMFELPLLQASQTIRTGHAQWLSEWIATAGLLTVIWGCTRYSLPVLAGAVGTYIAGAYWFTASTSFANPAVTIARTLTDTFAGIRPIDAIGFVAAQLLAVLILAAAFRGLSEPSATSENRKM